MGEGGPAIQLLGPYRESSRALLNKWPESVRTAETEYKSGAIIMGDEDQRLNVLSFAEQRYVADPSIVNDTSIAFVLRHGGHSIAVCSDSHAETLVRSIGEDFGETLKVDVATLPHHGSAANMSVELAKRLQARYWIVSTDGGRSREKKPTRASIARVLASRKPSGNPLDLTFNYDKPAARVWDNVDAMAGYNYSVRFTGDDDDFVMIRLPALPQTPPDAD